jgi:hypothetical protein
MSAPVYPAEVRAAAMRSAVEDGCRCVPALTLLDADLRPMSEERDLRGAVWVILMEHEAWCPHYTRPPRSERDR